MDNYPVNPADLVILAIILISGICAFFRGFIREVLSVAGWIGAAVATLQLFPLLQPLTRRYIETPLLADAATGITIFVVSLFLFSFLSHAISKRVQTSAIGAVDRSLGFVFGLIRGLVVLSIGWLLLVWVSPPAEHPAWLREARLVAVLERGGELLLRLVPGQPAPPAGEMAPMQPTRMFRPEGAKGEDSDSGRQTGYNSGERRALDQLLQTPPPQ